MCILMMQLIQLELHYILTLTHPFLYLFHRVVPLNDNKEAVTVPITDLREGEMVSPRACMFEQRPCGDTFLFIAFDVIEINHHLRMHQTQITYIN